MKWLVSLIVLIGLSSCLTVGRIERNCDKFAQVCITEKVIETVYRDTTIYKDRIVKVTLPNDTVRITDTVSIINNKAYMPLVHKRFGVVWAEAKVYNSILNVSAGLVDSTILIPVHDTIFLEKVIKEQAITNTVTVKHIPAFYKRLLWFNIVLVLVAIIYAVIRLKLVNVQKILDKVKNLPVGFKK